MGMPPPVIPIVSPLSSGRPHAVINSHGYIHCMPQGKVCEPFWAVSIPIDSGLYSGSVPFVCRLFPRHPGYVMMVCAVAIAAELSTVASMWYIANILFLQLLSRHSRWPVGAVSFPSELVPSQGEGIPSWSFLPGAERRT